MISLGNWIAITAFVAACGGSQTTGTGTGPSDEHPGVVADTRPEFEKRLSKACDALGPKLTACAVEDAGAKLTAGEISQKEHDAIVKPDVQAGLTKDWHDRCDRPDKMSSRQLRVLEVCFAEEQACAPLLDCLANLTAPPGT